MQVLVVGIDCATVDAKVGLARGIFDGGRVRVEETTLCTRELSAAKQVTEWICGTDAPRLIAIDAPLGWPAPMARALSAHRAGKALPVEAHEMFRRRTDRVIYETLRKTPLDVGADRIARTAHAALKLLGKVADEANTPIPLAWNPRIGGISAIEVYPAATLVAHGIPSRAYKAPLQIKQRQQILDRLRSEIDIDSPCVGGAEASADMLDAVVCLLAAKDFLLGRANPPGDLALAQQEGWIWVSASRA